MEIPEGPRHGTKMRMRNLRAKVKLLLPNNICRHYKDRNAKIQKFQYKRQKSLKNIRTMTLKDQWCQASKQLNPWYYEPPEPFHMFAQFNKLTKQQLEEISDNKHYFLPQKYIEPFIDYISKQNNPKQQSNKPISSSTKKRRFYHKSQASSGQIPIVPNLLRTSEHLQRHGEKVKQVQERYQILEEIRKNRNIQKQGFIQAKLMKAMNMKHEMNEIMHFTHKSNMEQRMKNVKNSEELRQQRSERTDIIRMTSELKRICTYRKKSKGKESAGQYHHE